MRRLVKQRTAVGRIANVDDAAVPLDGEGRDRLTEPLLVLTKLCALEEVVRWREVVASENRLAEQGALVEIARRLTAEPRVARNHVDVWRRVGDECHLRGSARRREKRHERADGEESHVSRTSAANGLAQRFGRQEGGRSRHWRSTRSGSCDANGAAVFFRATSGPCAWCRLARGGICLTTWRGAG